MNEIGGNVILKKAYTRSFYLQKKIVVKEIFHE